MHKYPIKKKGGFMKIAIDAMGGDKAPEEIVSGAVMAANEIDAELFLIGDSEKINECLKNKAYPKEKISIIHASEVITNDDKPTVAVQRKKDSSMVKALKMVGDGEADAMVSAGNTGALLAGSLRYIKRIRGIHRPALAPYLPGKTTGCLVVDGGANTNCKVENLVQFAVMGSVFSEKVMHTKNPRVGLLNNGTEEGKGSYLYKDTYMALKETNLNFIGNIEARDALSGVADVIVCDGFSGNILLKSIEGAGVVMFSGLKDVFMKNTFSKIGTLLLKKGLFDFKKKYDYNEYGGAPFLGVRGCVLKAHGSSNAKSIYQTIKQANDFAGSGAVLTITKQLGNSEDDEIDE